MSFDLSQAIDLVVSAPSLSPDQIDVLQSKLDTARAENVTSSQSVSDLEITHLVDRVDVVYNHFLLAHRSASKSLQSQRLFKSICTALSGWEIAWRFRTSKIRRAELNTGLRDFDKYKDTAFDIRQLADEEKNLAFMLAYAEEKPFGLALYHQVLKSRPEYVEAGRMIRTLVEVKLHSNRFLANVFPDLPENPDQTTALVRRDSVKRKQQGEGQSLISEDLERGSDCA
jgi:hypothetical protein